MNAPVTRKVSVPFYSTTSKNTTVLVTVVFIQIISYGDRFFWIHISEGNLQPNFGSLGMAISSANTPVMSTLLTGGVTGQSTGIGVDTSEQSFVTSLSRQISRTMQKKYGKQVGVLVNCSVSNDKKLLLIGTDAGGGFDTSRAFGALVFSECIRLIAS